VAGQIRWSHCFSALFVHSSLFSPSPYSYLQASRGDLAVSMSSYETTGPGSILGVAIFPGSGVADSKRSDSRDGSSSAIKMPAVKSG